MASHDEEEEALLDQFLAESLPTPPSTSSASADHDQHDFTSSNNTALGVVGMLRRLRLWTEEDAQNGRLTILPRSIGDWLRSTERWVPSCANPPPPSPPPPPKVRLVLINSFWIWIRAEACKGFSAYYA